jgi:hypothetical protein
MGSLKYLGNCLSYQAKIYISDIGPNVDRKKGRKVKNIQRKRKKMETHKDGKADRLKDRLM